MTAFLDFLNAFAIWIYIAAVVGILFGIKMLVDSRRLSRATMFTLEQEQAGDKAFRAVLIMLFFMFVIGGVSAVNAFAREALDIPTPEVVARQPTPFITPVIYLPTSTFTTVPTLTAEPNTPVPQPTTAPQQPSSTSTQTRTVRRSPTGVAATRAPTQTSTPQPTPMPTQTQAPPTQPPPPTKPAVIYPAPPLNAPPPNDSIGRNFIQFIWGKNPQGGLDVPANLPPDQFYRVTIRYTERTSGQAKFFTKCTHENLVDTRSWPNVLDTRGNAVDFKYSWFVVVIQAANTLQCESGGGSALSPQSAVNTFVLP